MSPHATYLQLPPELGGLRYGPFRGPVQVGSDAQQSQLVLDPSHGIFPVHATVAQTEDGMFMVGPAQASCNVFLVPQGQPQVWPVRGPAQARAGDQVVFGTPAGPRFILLTDAPQRPQPTAASTEGPQRPRAKGEAGFIQSASGYLDRLFGPPQQRGIAGEISRRSRAKMLTRGPWRHLYNFHSRYKTGALTSPVYIVGALTAAASAILAGGASCSGILWAAWQAVVR